MSEDIDIASFSKKRQSDIYKEFFIIVPDSYTQMLMIRSPISLQENVKLAKSPSSCFGETKLVYEQCVFSNMQAGNLTNLRTEIHLHQNQTFGVLPHCDIQKEKSAWKTY